MVLHSSEIKKKVKVHSDFTVQTLVPQQSNIEPQNCVKSRLLNLICLNEHVNHSQH